MSLLAVVSQNLGNTLSTTRIGRIVAGAVVGHRPTTWLQLGMAIMLSRQRKLLGTPHAFGICTSYYEYRRIFRLTTIRYPARIRRGIGSSRADYLGMQINSQQRLKATYAYDMMVMIIIHASSP